VAVKFVVAFFFLPTTMIALLGWRIVSHESDVLDGAIEKHGIRGLTTFATGAVPPNHNHKKTLSAHHDTTPAVLITNKPKAQTTNKTMKFIQMITAALAGTVADWDIWGKSLSSLFVKNTTKNTKIMFTSLQWEIAEMLTAPPSIFVPVHTVLDSSIPFIHVDAVVPSFDFSVIVSSFEDLRGVFSFESIRQQAKQLLFRVPTKPCEKSINSRSRPES
jgi:hypothetical protein